MGSLCSVGGKSQLCAGKMLSKGNHLAPSRCKGCPRSHWILTLPTGAAFVPKPLKRVFLLKMRQKPGLTRTEVLSSRKQKSSRRRPSVLGTEEQKGQQGVVPWMTHTEAGHAQTQPKCHSSREAGTGGGGDGRDGGPVSPHPSTHPESIVCPQPHGYQRC